MPGRDDALTWDGDDDPTLDVGEPVAPAGADAAAVPRPDVDAPTRIEGETPATTQEAQLPEGWTTVGNAGAARAPEQEASDGVSPDAVATSAPLGNAALVALGVLGGIYLLYAIGWLIGGLRLQGRYQVLVTDAMFQGALWLATAAPLIWFTTTILATRRARSWVRWAWLAAGVVLLIPWVFVMIGAVGR